jgi:hypothetical protein
MPGAELVILFGNELPEVDASRIGFEVADGTKASIRDLSSMVLALSIGDLCQQGAGSIEQSEVKKLLRTKRTLTFRSNEAGEGFSQLVARAAAQPIEVRDLALKILGRKMAGPDQALLGIAASSLEPTGATRSSGGIGAAFGVKATYAIERDKAALLRPEWERLRGSWEQWKAADPQRAEAVVEGCRKSMSAAKEAVDST